MRKALLAAAVMLWGSSLWAENIIDAPWENSSDPQWQGGSTTIQTWEASWGVEPITGDPSGANLVHYPVPDPTMTDNPYGDPYIHYYNGQPAEAPGWPPESNPNDPPPIISTVHIGDYDEPPDPIGGGLDIVVPNDPTPRLKKVIQLQVTSDKGISTPGLPSVVPGGTIQPGQSIQWPNSNWYTYEFLITIEPNPESETIHLDFPDSADIAEIVVKTICVPEPATLILLASGFGFLGLLLFRKQS